MDQPEPPISVVRQKVLATFQALGADDGGRSETILILGGRFVGRRFRQAGLEAVWLASERRINIFNEAGDLIDAQVVDDDVERLRKAA